VIVVVPRLPGALIADRDKPMLASDAWRDTSLDLPGIPLFNVFRDNEPAKSSKPRALADIFAHLPVALFSTRPSPGWFSAA
jgi:maltooligosyltrehalose synthase